MDQSVASPEVQPLIDPSFATGLVLRRYAESTLGMMNLDDMFNMATAVAAQPRALGQALGMSEEQAGLFEPLALRERLMSSYFSQRFAQDLAETKDEAQDEADMVKIDHITRGAICAGVSADQLGSAISQAQTGDCSALNRMEEIYLFE